MRAYSLLFICLLAGVFFISGCNNSSGSGRSAETGTAAFKIQWPAQVNRESANAPNRKEKIKSLAVNERSIQADLSEECEARKVAEIQVEVRDDNDRHLVTESFACELGEGKIAGIAVGGNRRFILSALDANGHERYHGEKAGVEIKTGVNEVGMIEMADVTSAPEVVIDAPGNANLYTTGTEIVFSGSASDAEDGALSGDALVWRSDIDGRLGTGTTVTVSNLSQGIHTIRLTAKDSDDDNGSASIRLTLNDPPRVSITDPEDDALYGADEEVYFSGSAMDTEDGQLSGGALAWTSSIDGQIGTVSSFFASSLSLGIHTITLSATDSDGASGSASINLTINDGPLAAIDNPPNASVYLEGTEIVFAGSAIDAEDGELTGESLVWTSDIDGQIGTGTSLSSDGLSAGTHTVTLTAVDSAGMIGTASVTFIINSPPVATIDRPYDGSLHAANDNITFAGSAIDSEDGSIISSAALAWSSDVDGVVGSGTSFNTNGLSSGMHEITFTAKDANGATGSDSVYIQVITPKLPDTGQTRSYTQTYGEDADYTVNPPSYTKLDENGKELRPTANTWAMVRDNVTGLVWEVKTTDGSIHEVEDTYTWPNAKTIFIENLNIAGFGGFTDWRLPTVMELYTIVSGAFANLALNQDYFPNRPSTNEPWYWSGTLTYGSKDRPWVVDLTSGEAAGYEGTTYYVMAVRGPELDFGRFVDNGDGTVTDTTTGLMWQQTPNSGEITWDTALLFCEEELNGYAGYTDWRMPNRHELHTIIDYARENPAINTTFFDHPSYSDYWTSTTDPGDPGNAYAVSFFSGFGYYKNKADYYTIVRAVRGGGKRKFNWLN